MLLHKTTPQVRLSYSLILKVNLSIVETTAEKSGISSSAQSLLAQGAKKRETKKPGSPGLKTSRWFFNPQANVGLNALKSKISAGKKLKNEANVETTAGLGRFDVFFPL